MNHENLDFPSDWTKECLTTNQTKAFYNQVVWPAVLALQLQQEGKHLLTTSGQTEIPFRYSTCDRDDETSFEAEIIAQMKWQSVTKYEQRAIHTTHLRLSERLLDENYCPLKLTGIDLEVWRHTNFWFYSAGAKPHYAEKYLSYKRDKDQVFDFSEIQKRELAKIQDSEEWLNLRAEDTIILPEVFVKMGVPREIMESLAGIFQRRNIVLGTFD